MTGVPLEPAARPGEQAKQRLGSDAGLAQGGQAGVAVALGEATPVNPNHQGDVYEARRLQTQRLVQQQLARRRGDEVVAADDLGDLLIGIVHDHGQLICGRAGALPHDEIAAQVGQG